MPDYLNNIVQQFNEEVSTNLQDFVERYLERFGTRIDTDSARELCPTYRDGRDLRPILAPLIHESASRIAKEVWRTLLDNSLGAPGLVIFLAGGPGSGKSTVERRKKFEQKFQDAIVIYDSTFSSFPSANQKIHEAIRAGKEIEIFYIYRHAEDAAYSMVARAVKTGRVVPLDVVADIHLGAQQTILQLCDRYRDSEDIMIHLINNSGKPEAIDWFENEEDLRKLQYKDIMEVRLFVNKGARKAYDRIQQDGRTFPATLAQSIFGSQKPF
jgi:predicted ABC-type ATPase